MKKKVTSVVAIFLAVCLLMVSYKFMVVTDSSQPMTVSLFWKKTYKSLDPASIAYINEAILIDNLYRNLISYDNFGNIVTDLADSFFWDGNSYVFRFKNEKLSSKGITLTAEDVLLSFKRLMLLDENSHGRLKKYVCGARKLTSLTDSCEGLYLKDGLLYVTPNSNISHDLLLNLFAGIDFKIIPKDSFQHSPPYKITDYSNTSGAYYIDENTDEVEPTFRINKNFEDANERSPQTWRIKSSELSESVSKLGVEFDLITTASLINWGSEIKSETEHSLFETLPIAIELLVFTKKGQEELSKGEKAYVGDVIRNYLLDKIEIHKIKTYQFFPPDSVGFLPSESEEELKAAFFNQKRPRRLVRIGFPKSVFKFLHDYKILIEHNIELYEFELTQFSVGSKEVDGTYVLTDTSVQEELTLLEYNFNFGIFGTDAAESSKWLERYVALGRVARIAMLKDFHFKVLSELSLIPLYAMPYYAIATKNYKFTMSKQNASTKIWKIQKRALTY